MTVFHVFRDGTVVLPICGGLGSGGGSQQPTSSTVVEKNAIPEEFLPFFTDLFERGVAASQQISDQPFPGQLTPSVQPLTLEALAGQEDIARGVIGSNIGQESQDLAARFSSGDFLDIRNNVPLQNAIQATIEPVFRQFSDVVLPGINTAAFEAGATGGSREAGALAQASQRSLESALNLSANLAFPEFQRQQAFQIAAPEIQAAGIGAELLPFGLLESVAQQRRGLESEQIAEAVARFSEEQAAPFRPLEPLSALLTGANLGTDRTSDISNTFNEASFSQQLIAGLFGGASFLNAGSSAGLFGPAGLSGLFGAGLAGAGATVGSAGLPAAALLAGFPSSRAFKKNRTPVYVEGVLNGIENLDVEKWQYKKEMGLGEDNHIGPYAEDFKRLFNVGDGVTIAPLDAVGVLLVAVKTLLGRVEELEDD